MAQIISKTTVGHMADMALHTGVGAVVGALATRYVVPLAFEQGAMIGTGLGAASGLVQKVVHTATGMEETAISKAVITAAVLGAAFFAATTYPAHIGTLLARVGLELTKDTMMKLFVGTFIGEIALGVITQCTTPKASADDLVAKLSKEEMKEALKDFDKRAKEDYKPGEGVPVPHSKKMAAAIEKRLVTDKTLKDLVKVPADDKIAKALQNVEVRVLFTRCEEIPKAAFKQFMKHLKVLNLFTRPITKEDVERMSDIQVKWAFINNFVSSVSYLSMHAEAKTALNERIKKAGLVKTPTNNNEVKKMTKQQRGYAYANFNDFTRKMDLGIKALLENAIVESGIVDFDLINFLYPKNGEAVAVETFITNLQLKVLHKEHDKVMKGANRATIVDLNKRYEAAGLAPKPVPPELFPPELSIMQKFGEYIGVLANAIIGNSNQRR